jgi:hypothetical protein
MGIGRKGTIMKRTVVIVSCLFTGTWTAIASAETVTWQKSATNYGTGALPSIAQSWNGTAAEVHETTQADHLDDYGGTYTKFAGPASYSDGYSPSVSGVATQLQAVEVHQTSTGVGPIAYTIGTLNTGKAVAFGKSTNFDTGLNPHVSGYTPYAGDTPAAVEVHQQSSGVAGIFLNFGVAQVTPPNNYTWTSVNWVGSTAGYIAQGENPAVAIVPEDGTSEPGGSSTIYYVIEVNQTVSGSGPLAYQTDLVYEAYGDPNFLEIFPLASGTIGAGTLPAVTFCEQYVGDGFSGGSTLAVVFAYEGASGKLLSQSATIEQDPSSEYLGDLTPGSLTAPVQYDTGYHPKLSCESTEGVEVHQANPTGTGNLFMHGFSVKF